jgi:hypothetical protein
MQCFLVTTWCPGPPSGRTLCLTPVLRLSTAPSPMVWQRLLGCASFLPSSTVHFADVSRLLRQHQCHLHVIEPRAASAHQAHRDRPSFCPGESCSCSLRVLHVPTSLKYANIFTKGLPSSVFTEFMSNLNVHVADDQTVGAC